MRRIIVLGTVKNGIADAGLLDEITNHRKELNANVGIEPDAFIAYYSDNVINLFKDKIVRGMDSLVLIVLNPIKEHLCVLNSLSASNSTVTVFSGTSVDGVVKLSLTSLQALIEQINTPIEASTPTPILAHIVAMRPNGLIGLNNTLPWKHNKCDMRIFREHTLKRLVLMGYNTVDSLPKALPNRTVVMVTKDSSRGVNVGVLDKCDHWASNGVDDLLTRLNPIMDYNRVDDRSLVMIAGGGKLYEETLDKVGIVYQSVIYPNDNNDQDPESKGVYYPITELEDNFIRICQYPVQSDSPEAERVQLNIWVRK